MKSKLAILFTSLITISISLLLAGCANNRSTSHPHHTNPTVALVTDTSDTQENPYNAAAASGLRDYANERNLSNGENGYQVFTPNYSSEIYSLVDQAAQKNFHLVIGMGNTLQNAIRDTADLYPKTKFALIDGKVKNKKNVANINFQSEQAAYLAGVIAARTTKTNVIGFIGGSSQTVTTKYQNGFIQGIHAQAKKDHKKIKILAKNAGTFSQPSIGKKIAQEMYRKNADIIFGAAGQTGTGIFQAAKKINQARPVNKNVWVIGVDTDQSAAGDYFAKGGQKANFTLTSVTNNITLAIKNIANQSYNDNFPGNKTITYNLKNQGVDVIHSSNITYGTWIVAQKARQDILNGKIKIESKTKS